MLVRELKYYRWESRGKDLFLYDKRRPGDKPFVIKGKVYAMSLHKFLPNHLDRIRIDGNKLAREKIRRVREQLREQIAVLKERIRRLRE